MDLDVFKINKLTGKSLRDRFFEKVIITEDCWEWSGCKTKPGYTRIGTGVSKNKKGTTYGHRVSYLIHKGEIPEGYVIDHICKNRGCVNPDHLEAVTQKENVLRGNAPDVVNYLNGVCDNGHKLTPENTYVINERVKGKRLRCRKCNIENSRRYRRNKKSKSSC